jgi:Ca-activated chloride channel family protein
LRAAKIFDVCVRPRLGRAPTNRHFVLLFFLLLPIVFSGVAQPQLSTPPQSRDADRYTVRVSVDLVVLHATVKNRKGVPVSGLGIEDFQVLEDGIRQQIKSFSHEDIPVTVGLVVDNSGSMGPKRPEVVAAALAFARSSNPEDQMFLVNFNENVSFGLPAGTPFTDKVVPLETALYKINSNGMTALYDAVAAALEHLKKGHLDKKVLIVVSDGADNASKRKLDQVMAMAKQSDAIIYTLGLFEEGDPDRNPHVLRQLSEATGGEAFLPESIKEVIPICEQIARDIRNQYTIVYVPANRKQDGAYRAIEVKAGAKEGRGRLRVRTRAGYYVPYKPQPLPAASNRQ